MASTLQDLRKEAGYKTAKEFAEAVGIPAPTYTRYEQEPKKIPTDRAWAIADKLGCSIDAVVGREYVDVKAMRGEFQKYFDTFTPNDQSLMWAIANVIKDREVSKEDATYDAYLSYYEKQLMQEADTDPKVANTIVFGSDEQKRQTFLDFLTAKAAESRASKVEDAALERDFDLELEHGFLIIDSEGSYQETGLVDKALSDKIADEVERCREAAAQSYEEQDKKTIQKIMAAYDRRYANRGRQSEVVSLGMQVARNVLMHYGDMSISDLMSGDD